MRASFSQSLLAQVQNPELVFLTGDLGFGALEPLRDALGPRFINAGIAEQNMVSVAAGLARQGLRPWVYSIAPFLYARPFEQIRNDVCLHGLPVALVGNGGGYGYGVMGSTHHALEDYGVLLTLPGLRVLIPAFGPDVADAVSEIMASSGPTYLRLGRSESPPALTPPAFAPWRRLVEGDAGTLVAVGPLAGPVWAACADLPRHARPNLWSLSVLPFGLLPEELLADIRRTDVLCVAEEHVAHGGAGSQLAAALLAHGCTPKRFVQRTALGYPSGRYGSQGFHRRECGLDAAALLGIGRGSDSE